MITIFRRILTGCVLFATNFSYSQSREELTFKTSKGDSIIVTNQLIFFNNKIISDSIHDIIYQSKYNKIVEQNSNIFFFLVIDGKPNYNKLNCFSVTNQFAKKVANVVYNDSKQIGGPPPYTDMDTDGNLEFGGFNLTEAYSNVDSMYYNPSTYYEIKDGVVVEDKTLERKMDIRHNGVYLERPFDKKGNCCVVVAKPKSKNGK